MSLLLIFTALIIIISFFYFTNSNYLIYFLLFCVVIMNININIFYLDTKNYYVNLVFIYLIAMFIIKNLRMSKVSFTSSKMLLTIQVSIIIQVLLLFFQFLSGTKASINEISMLLSILILTFIFSKETKLKKEVFLKMFSFVILFNSFLGFAQWITKKPLLLNNDNASLVYTEGLQDVIRVIGIVGSSNGAGNLGAIFFPITMYMYLKNKNTTYFLIVLTNLVFLMLTLTRIGILAAIIASMVLVILFKAKTLIQFTLKYFFIFCTLLIIVFVWVNSGQEVVDILFNQRGNTAGSRFIQYNNILTILNGESFKEVIFGIGSGEYTSYLKNYYGTWDIVIHSILLNKLIEEGLISFLSYIIMISTLTIYAVAKIENGYKWIPVLVTMCYIITSNFNPAQYYYVSNMMYYIFMIGIPLINNNQMKIRKERKIE